jgi:hypothetical protein
MILRPLLFFSTCAVLFNSCLIKQRDSSPARITLQRVDSISIPLNDETRVNSPVQLIRYKEQEWLSCYQLKDGFNRFHWYSLDSLRYSKTFRFAVEGPDGVGRLSPVMQMISFDRILLHPYNVNKFYLADSSGRVRQIIDLTKQEEGFIHGFAYFPPLLVDDRLYFFRMADLPLNSKSFFKQSKIQGIYDLKTGRYSVDEIGYPSYPSGYEFSVESWKASRCMGPEGEMVFSFAFDPALYVLKRGVKTSVEIPNTDRPDVAAVTLSDGADMKEQMAFIASTGLYTYLMYDPFRGYYYRIYLLAQPAEMPDGSIRRVGDFNWKIEIVDTEFRLAGTYYFEAERYNSYRVMVSSRGLLVSRDHAYRPEQEDYFGFDVFVPVVETRVE